MIIPITKIYSVPRKVVNVQKNFKGFKGFNSFNNNFNMKFDKIDKVNNFDNNFKVKPLCQNCKNNIVVNNELSVCKKNKYMSVVSNTEILDYYLDTKLCRKDINFCGPSGILFEEFKIN